MSLRSPAPAHLQAQIFTDVLPGRIRHRSPEEGILTVVNWQVPADNNPWQRDFEVVGSVNRCAWGKLAALSRCMRLNALQQRANAKIAEKK